MGMSHKPPKPHYGRKHEITRHALERFRERVDEEFSARDDDDLCNLLDERIQHSDRREEILDAGRPTTVVFIANRNGTEAIAILRGLTCITVLDPDMLVKNLTAKIWDRKPLNTPFRILSAMKVETIAAPPAPPPMSPRVSSMKVETFAATLVTAPAPAPAIPRAADHADQAALEYASAARDYGIACRRVDALQEQLDGARAAMESARQRHELAERAFHAATETAIREGS